MNRQALASVVTISCLIVALFIAYYFVIYFPKQQKISNLNLQTCISKAEGGYYSFFGGKTRVPMNMIDFATKRLEDEKALCAKLYPPK